MARRWGLGGPLVAALVLGGVLAGPAHARSKAGVSMAETMSVGGATLNLNGMAVRKKFIVSVYVGGLYLAKPARSESEVLTPDTPKALIMHFVHDVDADKLKGAYRDGFSSNARGLMAAEKANMDRFLSKVGAVKEGDKIVFTYVPGKGSTVVFPGGAAESFQGKGFADAYLAVFVGKDPPTDDLKDGLLGK